MWAPTGLLDWHTAPGGFGKPPGKPKTSNKETTAFMEAMARDGCLRHCNLPANCSGFVREKNETKVRFLANLADLDQRQPLRPPAFKLPSPEALAGLWDDGGSPSFCSLDIQNAYWSILLPAKWRTTFRLSTASGAGSLAYTTLPF